MKLHELTPAPGSRKAATRRGRGLGSGLGKTAGRGQKGQKSRSGVAVSGFEGGQMPLYRRIAHRGFSNYPFKKEYAVFNLTEIEEKYSDGETVSKETLTAKGLLKKSVSLVKVLGNGEITKKVTIDVDKISASAKEKVEKAGGSVVSKDSEKTEEQK